MELNNSYQNVLKLGKCQIVYHFEQNRMKTNEYEVIKTSCGAVRGVKRKNTCGMEYNFYAFEGIPFAKPPLGALRFREPQPVEPWHGILDCTTAKSKPKQAHIMLRLPHGSEDCLYLNIYTKKLYPASPLPVMVWIYGGGLQGGEASRDFYAPDYFMMCDVIIVTFNYRSGILGFLCLDNPELNIPGNAGLKDQVMALKWIKNNIHNFNGDPNNITVFGQSAGAFSAHMLMLSPQAKGLFHKAILQSGSALSPWAYTERHDWGYRMACKLGYKGTSHDYGVLSFLMKQPAERLVDFGGASILTRSEKVQQRLTYAFVAVIEPYTTKNCIVNKPFKELLRDAWGNDIPIIIGGTSDEGLLYHCMTTRKPYLLEDLNQSGLINLLPPDVKRVHETKELQQMAAKLKLGYFKNVDTIQMKDLFKVLHIQGHRNLWLSMYRTIKARLAYASNSPTYCYCFSFDSPHFNHFRGAACSDPTVRGACHCDDISYLFRNFASGKLDSSSREFKCIERMIGMWYNFALSSNPNCKEILPTTWQKVKDADQSIECLVIGDEVELQELPDQDKMSLWSEFYTKESLI